MVDILAYDVIINRKIKNHESELWIYFDNYINLALRRTVRRVWRLTQLIPAEAGGSLVVLTPAWFTW